MAFSGAAPLPVVILERFEARTGVGDQRGLRPERDGADAVLERAGPVNKPGIGGPADPRRRAPSRGRSGSGRRRRARSGKSSRVDRTCFAATGSARSRVRRGASRRLVPHGRPRARRRGRLLHDRRPQEGHDPRERLQRLPDRGGERAPPAPEDPRRGGRSACRTSTRASPSRRCSCSGRVSPIEPKELTTTAASTSRRSRCRATWRCGAAPEERDRQSAQARDPEDVSEMIVERLREALGDGEGRHRGGVRGAAARLLGACRSSTICRGAPRRCRRASCGHASVSDVVQVVNACRETGTPLVPFGLGSGVCGGVLASANAVVLDLGAMSRVRGIDPVNLLASFDAGVRGTDAEAALQAVGLTLGHYPQSIGVSSVGGWVATRAAGQFSTGYGNVEDVLFSLEAVLPNGDVVETRRHAARVGRAGSPAAAPRQRGHARRRDRRHLLGATRAGEAGRAAYHVATMDAGFEVQRELLQRGLSPVVLRQYDATEAQRMFSKYARGEDSLLLAVFEGPARRVDAESAEAEAVALGWARHARTRTRRSTGCRSATTCPRSVSSSRTGSSWTRSRSPRRGIASGASTAPRWQGSARCRACSPRRRTALTGTGPG